MDSLTSAAETLGNASLPRRTPQSCRFGQTTLFLAFPDWLGAWDSPWSCGHQAHPGPLEATDTCATCPDWRPATLDGVSVDARGRPSRTSTHS
jgi:hypothetical protein